MPNSALQIIDITLTDGQRKILGPYGAAYGTAAKIAEGVRATGAAADVLDLDPDGGESPEFSIAGSLMWPPRGFRLEEVSSIYVEPTERYVVSMIAGYHHDPDDGITDAESAAQAAVGYFTDYGDAHVHVFDRQTGHVTVVDRRDDDDADSKPVAPTVNASAVSDEGLGSLLERRWARVRCAEAALRPLVVERLARAIRDHLPDAHVVRLRADPYENGVFLCVDGCEDESGDALPTDVLGGDERIDAALADLTHLDGPQLTRLALPTAARGTQVQTR